MNTEESRSHEQSSPGAIPFTLISSGSSSCASDATACPTALFENMYGYENPAVAASFVQPFMLLVMMTCGANFFAAGFVPEERFHASNKGKNAIVNQYGPTALTLKTSVKLSSGTASKSAFTYALATPFFSALWSEKSAKDGRSKDPVSIPALLKRTVKPPGSRSVISDATRAASAYARVCVK